MIQIFDFLEKHPMTGAASSIGGWLISTIPTYQDIFDVLQACSLVLGILIGITVLILKIDNIIDKFFRKK